MKENWTDLHIEFAETFFPGSDKTIQKKWEEKGFDFREAQKWVEIGFNPKEELDTVYYFCLPDYWKKNGFTFQQTHKWIKAGLKKNEFDFACYLKNKGFTPESINLSEEKNKKNEAQDWLETIYPSERRKNAKFVMITTNERKFDGNLLINNWENLESFCCDKNNFSRLEVTNCPNLKKIFANGNKLVNFRIDKCPQIEELHLDSNELKDLSIFSNLNNLKVLSIRSSHFDSGLEYLPASVEKIYCMKNLDNQLEDYGGSYQSWRKDHQELIAAAQKVIELENTLSNLTLSQANHLFDEKTEKGLSTFIFETEEEITERKKELQEIKKRKLQAKQETLPKS